MTDDLLSGIELRSIGPAYMSGRIADIEVDRNDPTTWYVAVGSGGVWKATNSGITWALIFDEQAVYSIGDVTIDPGNSNVIWVGTGKNVGGRHVSFGEVGGGTGPHYYQELFADPHRHDRIYIMSNYSKYSDDGGKYGSQLISKTNTLTTTPWRFIPATKLIVAGILLMLKKNIDWIQPPSQVGIERDAVPAASLSDLFDAAKSVEIASFTTWSELERADFKTGKDIVKFVSKTNWEVQVDTNTAEVLQVAKRRSDLIEAIHDGSFFAGWIKIELFLPAGIVLLILWLTGIYLFVTTELSKSRKRA